MNKGDAKEMTTRLQQRNQDEPVRVQTALEKDNSPLSCEKLPFVKTCCQIIRMNSDERATLIVTPVVYGRRGDHCRTTMEIRKLLKMMGLKLKLTGHHRPPTRPPAMQKVWRPMCAALGTWRTALGVLMRLCSRDYPWE
jgi:hypothetical protein